MENVILLYLISDLIIVFLIIADQGESYNYKDEIAQAYCASKFNTGPVDIVSAVRRDCENSGAVTCDTICTDSTYPFRMNVLERMNEFPNQTYDFFRCFAGLWIWPDHPTLCPGQTGRLNMVTISYDDAAASSATDCGPNYCCCLSGED